LEEGLCDLIEPHQIGEDIHEYDLCLFEGELQSSHEPSIESLDVCVLKCGRVVTLHVLRISDAVEDVDDNPILW
jgi:hypothetical protein